MGKVYKQIQDAQRRPADEDGAAGRTPRGPSRRHRAGDRPKA
jgi:hypothetical protein